MKRLIKAEKTFELLDLLKNANSQIKEVQNELRKNSNYDFSQELKDLNRVRDNLYIIFVNIKEKIEEA